VTGPVIDLRQVSKHYTKYDDTALVGARTRLRTRSRRSVFEAVRDLDLQVDQGDSLGVLGRNGAGKSTLLQMLCGVTAPTSGRVAVRGRVAPLISVGVGFHPELTGRENVYVNGTVLGMTGREIDRRFDAILDFAEIDEFIDTPVKFYSSGMFVRLGFAVAVAADPDVLLVDEVLAVGDFAFQVKCFRRMEEIRAAGTTIVVVSHNVGAIRNLCTRGIVITRGTKTFDGGVHDAVAAYYEGLEFEDEEVGGDRGLTILSFEMLRPDGHPTGVWATGDEAVLRMQVRAVRAVEAPIMGVTITSESGAHVYTDTNLTSPFGSLAAGQEATYEVQLALALTRGSFTALSSVHEVRDDGTTQPLDRAKPVTFFVGGRDLASGSVDLGGTFTEAGR
jgi:ABC-type polysaccharide/polyol phosphate transport system ATPase subunit